MKILESVRSEILNLSRNSSRFDLLGYYYDDNLETLVFNKTLKANLVELMLNREVQIYKVKRRNIQIFDNKKNIASKDTKYIAKFSTDDKELLYELLDNPEGNRSFGSILFDCELESILLRNMIANAYDPNFTINLSSAMTSAALRSVKKRIKDETVSVLLSESGFHIISIFSAPKNIEDLLNFAFSNSNKSKQFMADYCEQ